MRQHSNLDYTLEEYLDRFYIYLERTESRNTHERTLILCTIYDLDGHFTLEDLQQSLDEKKQIVNRTTLYKTLEMFEDAGLIVKHHFSEDRVEYEKFRSDIIHDHLYIKDANKVIEFSDSRVEEIIKHIEETYNITAISHTFAIYGRTKNEEDY
jgi:Fur family ferric uptake transcriptional regulator